MLPIRPIWFHVHGLLPPQRNKWKSEINSEAPCDWKVDLGHPEFTDSCSQTPYGWLRWGSPVEKEEVRKPSPGEEALSSQLPAPTWVSHFQAMSVKGAWQKDSLVPSADCKLQFPVGLKLTPSERLQGPGGAGLQGNGVRCLKCLVTLKRIL